MSLLLAIFGICQHKHIGWPRTRGRKTTITCLDCCRTMPYDWKGLGGVKLRPPIRLQDSSIEEAERIFALPAESGGRLR